ncbi:MAG: HPF/RaiA family ribosome-associated protein [bacterium]|nr:HPF/RaiA family ribosome-associated protein [bacterium]
MRITIRGKNLELTETIKDYINNKIGGLEKFSILGGSTGEKEESSSHSVSIADVEVGVLTHHHKSGKIFIAMATLTFPKHLIRAEAQAEDLYQAIDEVRDKLEMNIESQKKGFISRKHRAALIWKKIKGLSPLAWLKNEFRKGKRGKEKF